MPSLNLPSPGSKDKENVHLFRNPEKQHALFEVSGAMGACLLSLEGRCTQNEVEPAFSRSLGQGECNVSLQEPRETTGQGESYKE